VSDEEWEGWEDVDAVETEEDLKSDIPSWEDEENQWMNAEDLN